MKSSINADSRNLRSSYENLLKKAIVFFFLCCLVGGTNASVSAQAKTCGAIFLRNSSGDIINPLTGENDDQPFSTRKTCGACHDYELITKGFHFQQGWEKISDTFDKKNPWILSDGMMGKH